MRVSYKEADTKHNNLEQINDARTSHLSRELRLPRDPGLPRPLVQLGLLEPDREFRIVSRRYVVRLLLPAEFRAPDPIGGGAGEEPRQLGHVEEHVEHGQVRGRGAVGARGAVEFDELRDGHAQGDRVAKVAEVVVEARVDLEQERLERRAVRPRSGRVSPAEGGCRSHRRRRRRGHHRCRGRGLRVRGVAAGKAREGHEGRLVEARVVVAELRAPAVLGLDVQRDVRRRVVVLGLEGRGRGVEAVACLALDGRLGKDGVLGRDVERARSAPISAGAVSSSSKGWTLPSNSVQTTHTWVAQTRRMASRVWWATVMSKPCVHWYARCTGRAGRGGQCLVPVQRAGLLG